MTPAAYEANKAAILETVRTGASGIARGEMRALAELYAASSRVIACLRARFSAVRPMPR